MCTDMRRNIRGCWKAISSIPVRLYYTYDDNIPHTRSLMAILDQTVHIIEVLTTMMQTSLQQFEALSSSWHFLSEARRQSRPRTLGNLLAHVTCSANHVMLPVRTSDPWRPECDFGPRQPSMQQELPWKPGRDSLGLFFW